MPSGGQTANGGAGLSAAVFSCSLVRELTTSFKEMRGLKTKITGLLGDMVMSYRDLSAGDRIDSKCRHATSPVFRSPFSYSCRFHCHFRLDHDAIALVPSGRRSTVDLIAVCSELWQYSTGA